MPESCRVGTASWSDSEMVRNWYPKRVSAHDRLPFYARRFDLVEVDSTFYAIPLAKQTAQWTRATPDGFLFDVKLHKVLSRHRCEPKFLPESLRRRAQTAPNGGVIVTPDFEQAALNAFLEGIAPLEDAGKLGALLLQLSPAFSPQATPIEALDSLLGPLRPRRVAVEVRNRRWLEPPLANQTISYFASRSVTLVSIDGPTGGAVTVIPRTDAITNPQLAYLRLHGRDAHAFLTGKTVAERFNYNYSEAELVEISSRIKALAAAANAVHVIFNNCRSNFAPTNASRFRELIGQVGATQRENEVSYETPDLFEWRSN